MRRDERLAANQHADFDATVPVVSSAADQPTSVQFAKRSDYSMSQGVAERRWLEAQRIARLGSWSWEPSTNQVWWSEALHELFGTDCKTTLPSFSTFLSLVHPDDQPIARRRVERMLAGADEFADDLRIVRPDGKLVWLHSRARAQRSGAGEILIVEGTDQDITDRKESENSLRVAQERLQIALQAASSVAFVWEIPSDRITRFFSVEPALPQTFTSPCCLQDVRARVFPDDLPTFDANLQACLVGACEYRNVYRVVRPDQSTGWLEDRGVLERDAAGRPVRLTGIVIDVTQRKFAEQQVNETSHLLNAVAMGTTDAVFVKDRDGRYLFANQATADFMGKSIDEVLGRDDFAHFDPESAVLIREEDRAVQSTGETQTREETLSVNGVTRTFLATKGPYFDGLGNILGVIGISRDITARKEIERALLLTQFSVDHVCESILWIDGAHQILYVNEQACASLGYTRSELQSLLLCEIDAKYNSTEKCDILMDRLHRQGSLTYETQHITKSGELRDVEVTNSRLTFECRTMICAVARDISARKRTERLLATQYAVVRVLADSIDMQSAAPKVLRAACTTGDWDVGEFWVLQGNVERLQLTSFWHRPEVSATVFLARAGEMLVELGYGLPGRVWESRQTEWWESLAADVSFSRTEEARRAGLQVGVAFPVMSGNTVLGVVALYSRKARPYDAEVARMCEHLGVHIGQFMERRFVDEQIRASRKLEAIGRLAGGIAHDFNNLLTVIRCHVDLMKSTKPDEAALTEHLRAIQHAGNRATELTSQLLSFSRKSTILVRVIDINEIVRSSTAMLRRVIREDISIDLALDSNLFHVEADQGQLERVLMNLAVNAQDAMPHGGRLRFATRNQRMSGEFKLRQHSGIKANICIVIEVSDTGVGMTEQVRARVLEPFFTTKSVGLGNGLGLSVVHGIVQQFGGEIQIDSSPRVGTTVRLLLPATSEPVTIATQVGRAGPQYLPATVLVVDDELAIQIVVRSVLSMHGFRVLAVSTAAEALRCLSESCEPIDVMLSDIVMPEMGGEELAAVVRKRFPQVKIVLMSGYAKQRGGHDDGERPMLDVVINKPFTPALLLETLHKSLARKAAENT